MLQYNAHIFVIYLDKSLETYTRCPKGEEGYCYQLSVRPISESIIAAATEFDVNLLLHIDQVYSRD